jgi:xylan 1,4-beta-xylosidase
MLSRLGDERIALHTTDATDPLAETYSPQAAYIGGLASSTREGDGGDVEKISVLLWHHADDRTITGEKEINLDLTSLPFEAGQRIEVKHWRIDHDHSNAYTVWQNMGRPEEPEDKQVALLKEAMQLSLLEPPFEVQIGADKRLTFTFKMPVHSLSLLELAPVF